MLLNSFLVLAGREGGSGTLLIDTGIGLLEGLFDNEETTLGVSFSKIFSLSDLDQLSV